MAVRASSVDMHMSPMDESKPGQEAFMSYGPRVVTYDNQPGRHEIGAQDKGKVERPFRYITGSLRAQETFKE